MENSGSEQRNGQSGAGGSPYCIPQDQMQHLGYSEHLLADCTGQCERHLECLAQQIRKVDETGNPIDYIRSAIEDKLDKNKEKDIPTILMGDFNAHWNGEGATYKDLALWAEESCLTNQIQTLSVANEIEIETFIRGENPSQIDHILTSNDEGLSLVGFGCATGAVWHRYNDHVPLWAEYQVVSGGLSPLMGPKEKQPRKHTPLVTPNIYKEEDVLEYEKQLTELLDKLPECKDDTHAGELLEQICRGSVTIARAVKPPLKKNKFFHDG